MAIRKPNLSISTILSITTMITILSISDASTDTNHAYSPCSDTKVQKSDGFSFGIAFASKDAFTYNKSVQLSPCDSRLALKSANSQIAVFRPKVDEISLLTINTTLNFSPESYGGYMVAFAGRKYAARSPPIFVANTTYTITSFTLVFEFQKGRLENLYWKRDGCKSCSGNSAAVCINKRDCAIKTSSCKKQGSVQQNPVDCSLGIQLAFSGTDKHLAVLNSWYEVENMRQYSLYGLYSDLKDSLTSQFNSFF